MIAGIIRKLRKPFLIVLTLGLITGFGLFRLHQLNTTPIHEANFSWINKAEIYGLGILMSAVAFPIYPEVAREHMMLYTPFNDDPKIINDDFFLRSPVVRRAVEKGCVPPSGVRRA